MTYELQRYASHILQACKGFLIAHGPHLSDAWRDFFHPVVISPKMNRNMNLCLPGQGGWMTNNILFSSDSMSSCTMALNGRALGYVWTRNKWWLLSVILQVKKIPSKQLKRNTDCTDALCTLNHIIMWGARMYVESLSWELLCPFGYLHAFLP